MSLIDPDADLCPVCNALDCEHSDEEKAAHAQAKAAGVEVPYNAGDPAQVAKTARKAKAEKRNAENDLRFIMDDERGRRFMWGLLSRCGIYRNSYLAGRGVPEATAFYEGERNIGLQLIAEVMAAAPRAYEAMQKENGK